MYMQILLAVYEALYDLCVCIYKRVFVTMCKRRYSCKQVAFEAGMCTCKFY